MNAQQELLPGTEVQARGCDALLLLTATPHNGNDRSLASLCELLDPTLVNGKGSLRGESYRGHVVRRLKRHIKAHQTGESLFKERIVEPIAVVPDAFHHPRFMELQRSLLDLIARSSAAPFGPGAITTSSPSLRCSSAASPPSPPAGAPFRS